MYNIHNEKFQPPDSYLNDEIPWSRVTLIEKIDDNSKRRDIWKKFKITFSMFQPSIAEFV